MSKWKLLPQNVPVDGQTVWIRLNANAYNVFQAVYSLPNENFISLDNNIIYSASMVWKWRPL